MWRWFRGPWCMGRIHGWWNRALASFCEDSTTVFTTGWRDDNLGEGETVDGCILLCMKRWQRRDYRKWRPRSTANRKQSYSSFQPGPLWTCVWCWSGVQGQGWTSGGGKKTGCRHRLQRRNGRRGRIRWMGQWRRHTEYVGGYCSKYNIGGGA